MSLRFLIQGAVDKNIIAFESELRKQLSDRVGVALTEAKFQNVYKMSNDEFDDNYNRFKKIKTGIVTHVYDDGNKEVATYNHSMGHLSTNRTHGGFTNVG